MKGYYLDNDGLIYKKCYESCETCETNGNITNHNCLLCHGNFSIDFFLNGYKNCYDQCPYYHYYDSETNEYHCLYSCPNDYPIVNETIKECSKNESNQYESNTIEIQLKKFQINRVKLMKNILA